GAGARFHSALRSLGGGAGGAAGDGATAVAPLAQGAVRLAPVEVQETLERVRGRALALRADSGGAGRQRGGLGVVLERELLAPCAYHGRYERTQDAPWGLAGGLPGETTRAAIVRGGRETEPPPKCEHFPL